MDNKQFTYIFDGQELQLLDEIATKLDHTRSVVITISLLSLRAMLHIPDIYECSLDEWIEYYNNFDRDDIYLGSEEV